MSIALIAAITGVYFRLLHVNSTTVALTFVLAVLGVATVWGISESLVASLVAAVAFNYFFLPPVGTFTIADPQNWVAFFAFLITAITASQLSTRARRRAAEAASRQRETNRLYEFGRAMLMNDNFEATVERSVYALARIFELRSAAISEHASGRTWTTGTDFPSGGEALRALAESKEAQFSEEGRLSIVPVKLGGPSIGNLGLTGADLSPELCNAIANLVALGWERSRAIESAGQAEAARRGETLKSALLDSLAHDLKTPLTAIKTCVTGLLSAYPKTEDRKRELLEIVDEETDHLHRTISEAIQMTRIEAGKLSLERSLRSFDEIMEDLLATLGPDSARFFVHANSAVPLLPVDAALIKQALRQILDNAARYTPAGSQVDISAVLHEDHVEIRIADFGPGVSGDERERIFEKFYRGGQGGRYAQGTGMGLSIAKGIIEAHGGRIWVANQPEGGAVFSLSVPLAFDAARHESLA